MTVLRRVLTEYNDLVQEKQWGPALSPKDRMAPCRTNVASRDADVHYVGGMTPEELATQVCVSSSLSVKGTR